VKIGNKLALGALLAAIVTGVAYFIAGSRQEKLQANLHMKVLDGTFPDLAKTCPNQVAQVGADEADYTLVVFWEDGKGWFYELERKDGAALGPDINAKGAYNPNASRVVRQVCRDIERDFPLWLNTQRLRASIGKPALTGATTSVDDDPPRRYEMMEYRNGTIVGLTLLDTKVGRTWLLTNLTDSGGKTVRTEFNEVSVQNLWESEDELNEFEKSVSFAKWAMDRDANVKRVKDLTRPIAIQQAENQAHRAR
jgi:hypothetical protein